MQRVLSRHTGELLASRTCSSCGVRSDVTGADESRTRWIRAVSPVLSVQLLFLALEVIHQSPRNELPHFTPGHDLLAASGWVKYLVLQGKPEKLVETRIAVTMFAWCLPDGPRWLYVVASCALKVAWRCSAVLKSFVADMARLGHVGLLNARDIDGRMNFRSA